MVKNRRVIAFAIVTTLVLAATTVLAAATPSDRERTAQLLKAILPLLFECKGAQCALDVEANDSLATTLQAGVTQVFRVFVRREGFLTPESVSSPRNRGRNLRGRAETPPRAITLR
jgi:hypothetical protein